MDFEKMLEKELKNNPELKKLFDEQPEKKAAYIEKLKDGWGESLGGAAVKNDKKARYCKNCAFQHGEPPYADMPNKAYCEIYPHGKSSGKPPDVYYEGAECEFYIKEKH